MLACDAFGDTSAPGGVKLAAWSGLINGRLYETLASLQQPNERRPALVERVDSEGRPIPEGKRWGGDRRTGYRLRTEFGPVQLSPAPGTVPDSSETHELSPATGRDEAEATFPGNSPGKLSRETLPGNSPDEPGDALPFPSLPSTHLPSSTTEGAPKRPGWRDLVKDEAVNW